MENSNQPDTARMAGNHKDDSQLPSQQAGKTASRPYNHLTGRSAKTDTKENGERGTAMPCGGVSEW